MLGDFLRIEGFNVITANNGNEGVKLFDSEKPDIVITDIIMPEKEGTETILEIKQKNPNIKIIAISGGGRAGFVDYLETVSEFGVDATFSKPFNNNEFIAKLKELINSTSG